MLTNKTFDVEKKNGAFLAPIKIPPEEEDGGDNTKNTEECVLDDSHYTRFFAHCNIFFQEKNRRRRISYPVVFLQN